MGFRALGRVLAVVLFLLAGLAVAVPSAGALLTPHTVTVSLSPDTVPADGASTSTATVVVRDVLGKPVDGAEVAPRTADDIVLGPVTGHGGGRYTFPVTASRTPGRAGMAVDAGMLGVVLATGYADLREMAGPPATIGLEIEHETVKAVRGAATKVNVTLADAEGRGAWGETVSIWAPDFTMREPVFDHGNGRYSTWLELNTNKAGVYEVVASAAGLEARGTVTATAGMAHHVRLELAPSIVPADGYSTASLYAWVEDFYDNPIPDAEVDITTDGDVTFHDVKRDCDGFCHSAIVKASRTTGEERITVTARDTVAPEPIAATAVLHEVRPEVASLTLTFDPAEVFADGQSSTYARVLALDAHGQGVENLRPQLVTDGDAVPFNDWLETGGGSYMSTVRASETPGAERLTVTFQDASGSATADLVEKPLATVGVRVDLTPEEVVADGVSTSVITATPRNSRGEIMRGDPVTFSTDGDATIGAVTDNGDGSYSAVLTASTTTGTSWVYATAASGPRGQTVLYERAGAPADIHVDVWGHLKADGQSTATVYMAVVDAHRNQIDDAPLTLTTDGDIAIGEITGDDWRKQAVLTASTTPGVEQLTATVVGTSVSRTLSVSESPLGGYWLMAEDSGVFAFGDAGFHGSMGGYQLPGLIVEAGAAPDRRGYWQLGEDGTVYPFGSAGFFGDLSVRRLDGPATGFAPTAEGNGYWVATEDGLVVGFGAADYHGSLEQVDLPNPIVDLVPTATGDGYWLVDSMGGVFGFGDAQFYGSPSGSGGQDVVSIERSAGGNGYWIVQADGVVHHFGDAADLPDAPPSEGAVVVAAAREDRTGGLYVVDDKAGVSALGSAAHHGDLRYATLEAPVTAFAPA